MLFILSFFFFFSTMQSVEAPGAYVGLFAVRCAPVAEAAAADARQCRYECHPDIRRRLTEGRSRHETADGRRRRRQLFRVWVGCRETLPRVRGVRRRLRMRRHRLWRLGMCFCFFSYM